MMLHGWCISCHKPKRVRVTMPDKRVPCGICYECDEKRRER